MFSKIAVMGLAAAATAAASLAAPAFAADKGLISIIVTDPSNPYWKTEGDVAAAEAKKLGYTCQCRRAQGRHQHRKPPDRHRHHQSLEGHHSRSRQCRRFDRRGQEGRCRQHSGVPRQRRNQPGRPCQGAARFQQRPGCRPRCTAVGQGHRREGQLCRAPRRAVRQQRRDPLERLRDRAQPVSRPARRSPRRSPTGTAPRATTRCRACSRRTPTSSA